MSKKTNKGVSLILSYVILIGIGLALSVGVYSWMKDSANISPPVDCDEGTSLIIENYNCFSENIPGVEAGMDLYVKNNGRFNVNGFVLIISNDSNKSPEYFLMPKDSISSEIGKGNYFFPTPIKPGETALVKFSNKNEAGVSEINNVTAIQLQPFIIVKTGKLLCRDSMITEKIENCQIA